MLGYSNRPGRMPERVTLLSVTVCTVGNNVGESDTI
jgi:hypothetical protein